MRLKARVERRKRSIGWLAFKRRKSRRRTGCAGVHEDDCGEEGWERLGVRELAMGGDRDICVALLTLLALLTSRGSRGGAKLGRWWRERFSLPKNPQIARHTHRPPFSPVSFTTHTHPTTSAPRCLSSPALELLEAGQPPRHSALLRSATTPIPWPPSRRRCTVRPSSPSARALSCA